MVAETITISGKIIYVYEGAEKTAPLIVVNTFHGDDALGVRTFV